MTIEIVFPLPPSGCQPMHTYNLQLGSGIGSRRSSLGSTTSAESVSSAESAASSMTADQKDNFRSMRGKPGRSTEDLVSHMLDDTDALTDRLEDVSNRKEIERRFSDINGEAYSILITSSDVRLCHVDEWGQYHYLHFGSFLPTLLGTGTPKKRYWHVIDDSATDHIFVDISPRYVSVYHQEGTWECRRSVGSGYITEVRDSPFDSRLGGFGQRKRRRAQVWRLNEEESEGSDSSEDMMGGSHGVVSAQLASNTPGEKGVYCTAYRSFYHDL